jgi:hypothetical protein
VIDIDTEEDFKFAEKHFIESGFKASNQGGAKTIG